MSHSDFAAALLDPRLPPPQDLAIWNGSDPARRFAVHRNNVVVSLMKVLEAKFPAAARAAPDAFWQAARGFVAHHPPRGPVLAEYGGDFPEFLARFAPSAAPLWLADLARLEALRLEAYHAADAQALGMADFAALDPAGLTDLRLRIHPAMRGLASRFPVVSIWAALSSGGAVADAEGPEEALITRPGLELELRALPQGSALFFARLAAGEPLGEAAGAALAQSEEFSLDLAFAALVSGGAVSGFTGAEGESS